MEKNVFSLGICMAGAVSAGAYTAGVMDYLVESLDRWEQRRGQEGIPSHRVVVKVIGGASAGGMTALLTGAALANEIVPVKAQGFDPIKAKQNKFYHTWVNLTDDDMMPVLLDTGDIHEGKKAEALLNSAFIDVLSKRALEVDRGCFLRRPYIDSALALFVTMSSVDGLQYEIGFRSNAPQGERYITRSHLDLTLFRLNTPGYRGDGFIPLSFVDQVNVDIARSAAMATGAFPLGLMPREIVRRREYIEDNPFINKTYPKPLMKIKEDLLKTLNVDGGMLNNEPFEITQKILMDRCVDPCADVRDVERDYQTFQGSVLMVDPFPAEEEQSQVREVSLPSMMGNIYRIMRGQLLFKPKDIEAAMNPGDYSRFMIAPKRKVNGVEQQGAMAMASGALGGFGGFMDKRFRTHDYFLGRRNCQRFLREHFTVPADTTNPLFSEGYRHVPPGKYRSHQGDLQIIPVLDDEAQAFPKGFDWPRVEDGAVQGISPLLNNRAEKIFMSLLPPLNIIKKFLLWLAYRLLVRKRLNKFILGKIREDLAKHNLL